VKLTIIKKSIVNIAAEAVRTGLKAKVSSLFQVRSEVLTEEEF